MTKYYHVWITLKGTTPLQRRRESERNLSFEDLETRFLIPYRTGRSLVVNGRTITPDELERVQVFETEQQLGQGVKIQWNMIPNVTNQFITGPPGSALESTPRDDQELRPPTDAQDVFVVHGRNSAARNAIFGFLRSIGLHPLEWSEATIYTGKPSPYVVNHFRNILVRWPNAPRQRVALATTNFPFASGSSYSNPGGGGFTTLRVIRFVMCSRWSSNSPTAELACRSLAKTKAYVSCSSS